MRRVVMVTALLAGCSKAPPLPEPAYTSSIVSEMRNVWHAECPGLDPARSAGYLPSQQAAGSSREGSASPEERKRVPGFNIGVGLVREPQPNDLRSA